MAALSKPMSELDQDSVSHLLNLPPELRLLIYEALKEGRKWHYWECSISSRNTTALLQTNREIYNEAYPILRTTSTLSIDLEGYSDRAWSSPPLSTALAKFSPLLTSVNVEIVAKYNVLFTRGAQGALRNAEGLIGILRALAQRDVKRKTVKIKFQAYSSGWGTCALADPVLGTWPGGLFDQHEILVKEDGGDYEPAAIFQDRFRGCMRAVRA